MNMKKILVLSLALIMVFALFVGCAAEPEEEPSPTHVTSAEQTPEPTPEEEPEEEIEEGYVPEKMSPTTGIEDTTTEYKPVIVQLGNESYERPQEGIQLADIVYETCIEGSDTRFTCLFNDVLYKEDAPGSIGVGAVRSSRYYHQWIQSEWDAIYVHMGGPDKTNNPESDIYGASGQHIKQRISGAGKGTANADLFYAWKSGKSISDYAAIDIVKAADRYNYEPKERQPFKYYPAENYDEEKEIGEIKLSFLNSLGFVSYEYDSENDKLIRSINGTVVKPLETGEPLEVQNLIVQYTSVTEMPNDAPRQYVNMFGGGPAEFIIHGKHLQGSWARATEDDITMYYLDNGEELTLAPGNTWIAVHPNNRQVTIDYADGSSYDSAEG